eukprot:Platyproteum_vivax@DN7243_c0_g1_i2.p1
METAPVFQHSKTARKIHRAKKEHRTEMAADSWAVFNYAHSNFCEKEVVSDIPVIDWKEFTVERFIEEFERPSKPCFIKNMIDDWPATKKWNFEYLKKNYSRAAFKIGEDDSGRRIRMRLKYFMDYIERQKDDSPLYLFESCLEDNTKMCGLLQDFAVPEAFPYDFMSVLGTEHRPPYRWFLVGPKRSGTTMHEDPLATAAWNALIVGHKRWALLPPHVSKGDAKGREHIIKGEDDEAIMWFDNILPRIRAKTPDLPIIEGVQQPGWVIFVPPKWWHAVVNLDDTIAVTQNFVSYSNFDTAWRETRVGRKKLSVKWLRRLERHHPDVAWRASQLNKFDQYRMMRSKKNAKSSSLTEDSTTDGSAERETGDGKTVTVKEIVEETGDKETAKEKESEGETVEVKEAVQNTENTEGNKPIDKAASEAQEATAASAVDSGTVTADPSSSGSSRSSSSESSSSSSSSSSTSSSEAEDEVLDQVLFSNETSKKLVLNKGAENLYPNGWKTPSKMSDYYLNDKDAGCIGKKNKFKDSEKSQDGKRRKLNDEI